MRSFKKIVLYSSLLSVSFGSFISEGINFLQAETLTEAKITASNLNVRSGPSLNDTVIGQLTLGEHVTVIETNGEWLKIHFEDINAFIHKDFVEPVIENQQSALKMTPTVPVLNVRDDASIESNVIDKLKEGQTVTIISQTEEWGMFDKDGIKGFAYMPFLKPSSVSEEVSDTSKSNLLIGEITASWLNIREKASTDSPIIGGFSNGEVVNYTIYKDDWLKVILSDTEFGFIHSDFVQPIDDGDSVSEEDAAKEDKAETEETSIKVNVDILNVRKGPSTNVEIIGKVKLGEVYRVISKDGSWTEVSYNGQTGFLHNDYIQTTSNTSIENAVKIIVDKASPVESEISIYSSPSTDSEVLLTLSQEHSVIVKSIEEDWVRIFHNEKFGYVEKELIHIFTEELLLSQNGKNVTEEENEEEETVKTMQVTASILNIRSEPSLNGNVVGKLSHFDVVEVYVLIDDWAKIKTDSGFAYVSKNFLRKEIAEENNNNNWTYTVSTEVLNIREKASINSERIGQLKKWEEVKVIEEIDEWYKIEYNNSTAFVSSKFVERVKTIDIKNDILKNKAIVLDAGHGGKDVGGIGNGLYEKNIVFDILKRLERRLEKSGATIITTRNDDDFLSLSQRTRISNNSKGDIFVSIHANANENTLANGIETFYYGGGDTNRKRESLALAQKTQEQLIIQTGLHSRGVKNKGFQVIKYNDIPSVLAEIGFLTNPYEASLLKTVEFKEKIANGLYEGIKEYFMN